MMGEVFKLMGTIGVDTSEAESGINKVVSKAKNLGKTLEGIGASMKKVGGNLTKGLTVPVIGAVTASVKAFADLEQAVGGVETLFKDSANAVIKNSESAYKRAGVSGTQYMEQVTRFSASLLQGLGGDTVAAAKIADTAMVDMSDNANKFGTNIQDIQNAYQGFAKKNYTMLDNLRLGYGGTASEMARLINDSGVLGDTMEVTAETVNDVSFDKIIEAIHTVQEEMDITGTTAKEATETVSGSFGMMKASVKDLAAGFGMAGADMETLMKNLYTSIGYFAKNIKRVLGNMWNNLPLKEWQKWVGLIVVSAGPALLVIGKMIDMLLGIPKALGALKDAIALLTSPIGLAVIAIGLLVAALVWLWNTNEDFRNAVIKIWEDVKEKVSSAIEALSNFIQDVWGKVTSWWNENQDGILTKANEVWNGLMSVVSQISNFVSSFIQEVWGSIKSWWDSNQEGFFTKASEIWNNILGVIMSLYDWFVGTYQGLWDSVVNWWSANQESFKSTASRVWDSIKNTFSTVFDAISGIVMGVWGPLSSWFKENQELIRQTIENVWNGILIVISFIINKIVPIILDGWDAILALTKPIWNIISNIIESVMDFILGVIKSVLQAINGDWSGAWNTIKTTASTVWNSIKSLASSIFNAIKTVITNVWNNIKSSTSTIWNSIKTTISNVVNAIKNAVSNAFSIVKSKTVNLWNSIKSSTSNIWNGIKSTISNVVNGIKTTVSNAFNSVKTNTTNKWNGIKSSITNAINGAKDAVSTAVSKLKSIMNFRWSLPHLRLPRISINGSFSLNPPRVPTFGIRWFADGGILTKATAFGMNGNDIMVGGEAGKEAVLPLNRETLGGIGEGIADTMNFGTVQLQEILYQIKDLLLDMLDRDDTVVVQLDGYTIARVTRDPMDRELGKKSRDNNQAKGRK